MKVKDVVTAQEIVSGATEPKHKIPLFKVKLVKSRGVLSYPVTRIGSSEDLARIARSELGHLPHEEVVAIGMNGRNEPIGVVKVSQGGISGSAMTPADVIRPLVAMGASAFVLAHNHPSGDPTPSQNDVIMTQELKKAAACVGISFLDHLIIASVRAGGRWSSLRDAGYM